MTDSICDRLLHDIILEINELALRDSIWKDSDFDRGYIAGMMVIMKAVEDEISAFDLPKGKFPNLVDVDRWFREGRNFGLGGDASGT